MLADNSGGSIQVGSATGVRVASAGGSIRLRGSSGSLRAVTDVGSILAELMSGVPLQDSILSTGAGDITVYIPSNLALTVKALNENGPAGRIVSEFSEIMVRQRSRSGPRARSGRRRAERRRPGSAADLDRWNDLRETSALAPGDNAAPKSAREDLR